MRFIVFSLAATTFSSTIADMSAKRHATIMLQTSSSSASIYLAYSNSNGSNWTLDFNSVKTLTNVGGTYHASWNIPNVAAPYVALYSSALLSGLTIYVAISN